MRLQTGSQHREKTELSDIEWVRATRSANTECSLMAQNPAPSSATVSYKIVIINAWNLNWGRQLVIYCHCYHRLLMMKVDCPHLQASWGGWCYPRARGSFTWPQSAQCKILSLPLSHFCRVCSLSSSSWVGSVIRWANKVSFSLHYPPPSHPRRKCFKHLGAP